MKCGPRERGRSATQTNKKKNKALARERKLAQKIHARRGAMSSTSRSLADLALRRLSSAAAGASGRGCAATALCFSGSSIGSSARVFAAAAVAARPAAQPVHSLALVRARTGPLLRVRGFAASAIARNTAADGVRAAAGAGTTAAAAATTASGRPSRDAVSRGPRALIRAYKQLAKFRLTCLVVATAAAGFVAGEFLYGMGWDGWSDQPGLGVFFFSFFHVSRSKTQVRPRTWTKRASP